MPGLSERGAHIGQRDILVGAERQRGVMNDAEFEQPLSHFGTGHRPAVIGVQHEPLLMDTFGQARFADQYPSMFGQLLLVDFPTDNFSAEDVFDHDDAIQEVRIEEMTKMWIQR